MSEFLINERSASLLNMIDAFKLSESELQDLYDGIFNRISEIRIDLPPKSIGFDDPMIYACDMCLGTGTIDSFEDHAEVFECPKCNGLGTISIF